MSEVCSKRWAVTRHVRGKKGHRKLVSSFGNGLNYLPSNQITVIRIAVAFVHFCIFKIPVVRVLLLHMPEWSDHFIWTKGSNYIRPCL
jgi:hypothetical protein